MFGLSLNESLTLGVAVYAAVVSTFVLGWDAYKWLNQGPKLKVLGQAEMQITGGTEDASKKWVSATVVNYGDRATTLTNMGLLYYSSWFRAYFRPRKTDQAFVILKPSDGQPIPHRFEPGAQWIGMAEQTEEIEQMIRGGYLFVAVYASTLGSGARARVVIEGRAGGDMAKQ